MTNSECRINMIVRRSFEETSNCPSTGVDINFHDHSICPSYFLDEF